MKQDIIAFTGISGVGKTTFLRNMQQHITFQHLTGGSLIAKARLTETTDRDGLRHADLHDNQRLLIEGFSLDRDPLVRIVIMDGHVIVEGSDGIQKVPASVFERLGISLIVHLEADPVLISQNRTYDTMRARPEHSVETLFRHQEISREQALVIASKLSIECLQVTHDDVIALGCMLQRRNGRNSS